VFSDGYFGFKWIGLTRFESGEMVVTQGYLIHADTFELFPKNLAMPPAGYETP
jgi:hypothetical protein